MQTEQLIIKSRALRRDILHTVYSAGAGHIGGDLSVCDILNILYNRHMNISPQNWDDPRRDHFVLSKGHCVEALYCVLADVGFFGKEELETVSRFGSKFIGHPSNKVPGIEIASGSLGHGLSAGVGMALALRFKELPARVYVVMGDGELAEGSVWEAAMSAGHYRLGNLIAFVDRNGLQISGPTEEVMSQEPLRARWESFGWKVLEADGNSIEALDAAITQAKAYKIGPVVILADTVKGCGVSFMENRVEWHHRVTTPEEYEAAMRELAEDLINE